MIREIELMCRQHDELRALVAVNLAELAKEEQDVAALSLCRWKLARLVLAHLAFEDTHFYPRLDQCGGRATATGATMASELGHLSESFQDHLRQWTPAAIAADWTSYRHAATALLTALLTRMDCEERELYPLAVMAKAA